MRTTIRLEDSDSSAPSLADPRSRPNRPHMHFRRPCFIYYQAYSEMVVGTSLSDAIVILSSMNVIAGELDA